MLDKHSDPAKVALAAVGAIPFCVKKERPMFARLKSYLKRLVCWALVIGIFSVMAYAVGWGDGLQAGRQIYVEEGIKGGINAALNDAANRGFGRWIVSPGNGSAPPQTHFLWLDDEFPPTRPNNNPCYQRPEDGVKQIGQPDRGASFARPRVSLCKVVQIHATNATQAETVLETLLTGEEKEKGITTLHSADPCDPLNFIYFAMSLLFILGVSALFAMGVHRIHVWRKSRIAH